MGSRHLLVAFLVMAGCGRGSDAAQRAGPRQVAGGADDTAGDTAGPGEPGGGDPVAPTVRDTRPPETLVLASPPASTDATAATFSFAGADREGPVTFECNRDARGWSRCASPVTYGGLVTGVHVWHVRSRDGAGNVDPSPAAVTWAVLSPHTTLSAACFTGATQPQLDLGGPDANWTWNDPHVLKVGGEYWMYASATDNFLFPVRVYRLTSADGITWARNPTEPVLGDAALGAWDAGGVETPAVVYFRGQYHLFYTSYPFAVGDPRHSALDYRAGHAVSNDGITFSRAGTAPTVVPSGDDSDPSNDWYKYLTAEPAPVVLNGELFLYFTTVGIDYDLYASLQVIGLVRSADGVTWGAPELALKPDQTLYPRSADWLGYSTPAAVVVSGGVHLFVDVANQPAGGDWRQLRLHHAYSPDGRTAWVQDAAPLRRAGDFAWARDEIRSPAAFLDGTVLRLYFAGHELDGAAPEHFAIGMLTCDLAVP